MFEANPNVFEVTFHSSPESQTVADGELKMGRRNFIEFPGVASCIPIVATKENGEILAAIHANSFWNPERLSETLKLLKSAGAGILEFAERIAPSDHSEYVPTEDQQRLAILGWLAQGHEGVRIKRSVFEAKSFIDHLGYRENKGFGRLQIVNSKGV